MNSKFLFIAAFILFLNCEKDDNEKDNIDSIIKLDKELVQKLCSEAYDTLIIESGSYVLNAYSWRDFQPISPPNGKSMYSVNQLVNIDSTEIPNNIDMVKQYVINKDSIWISGYSYERQGSVYIVEKVSTDGPKWGPKIFVDIISQIHDSLNNRDYFLQAKNVYIGRTD